MQAGVARLIGRWRITALEAELIRLMESPEMPQALRAGAIGGLARFPEPAHTGRILKAAGPDAPTELKAAAAVALAGRDLGQACRLAAEVLARDSDPATVEQVLAPILRQSGGTAALASAFAATPPSEGSVRAAAAFLARAGRTVPELASVLGRPSGAGSASGRWASPAARQEFLKTVAASGDAIRGARVFTRPELGCTACHGIGASQPGLGPDLGALGTAQTPEFILRALLEPQAEVKEGFMSWTLTLLNGEEIQGRIESSSPQEVVLLDAATRKPLRLARSEIRSQTQAGSIMPAGLVDGLSDTELRDLLRYLAGLGRRD